jgi:hypothetical protein
MTMLLQEAERQDLRSQKRKQTAGKSKDDEKGEALAVSTEKPKGKRDLSKICCWSCGKYGHFSSKCTEEKKAKDNKSTSNTDSKKEGTLAAAVEHSHSHSHSSDDEGAWAAEEVGGESAEWFLEVVDGVMGDAREMDWFEEECADVAVESFLRKRSSCLNLGSFDVPCDPNFKRSDLSSKNDGERGVDDVVLESVVEASREESVEELLDTSGVAFVVAESVQSAGRAELYDSGCTNHISPYRDLFENFQSITPRHFRAANKQTFSTVGKGDIVIDIPNGKGETQIRLQDVLYSAEVGYTLVSVGRLDEAGFTVVFGGGKCTLRG